MNQYPFLNKITFLSIFIISFGMNAYAQSDIENKFPTKKLRDKTIEDRKKNHPKKKSISYIYKKSTLNTLYGNPCAISVTRRYRFEYAVEEKKRITSKNFYKRGLHNLGVKFRLFVTKGPWWKIVVNKRLKDCKRKTGDSTG